MSTSTWNVYLMSSRKRNAIYCGCTDELAREVRLIRSRRAPHLVGTRHLTHVLWRRECASEEEARATCLAMRKWSTKKKRAFVEDMNPQYECILAAERRMLGDKPRAFNWRKLAKEGEIGPDGPTELVR